MIVKARCNMSKIVTITAFLATATAMAGPSARAADIRQGEQLAVRWCASCHAVPASQNQVATEAPPFAVIARKPDFTEAQLVQFLLEPHPKMPNMSLSRSEAADIAAYIRSLAR
jgi:mono/diheme cytochrome c family protein